MVFSPRGQGSGWSARSRAAARTNELDAGKRRKIIEGEEGASCGIGLCEGRVRVPGARLAEWSHKHPSGAAPVRGCHDHMSGTGLLSHVIERGAGAGSCRKSELTRGLATLPVSWPPRRRAGVGGLQLSKQVPGAGQ